MRRWCYQSHGGARRQKRAKSTGIGHFFLPSSFPTETMEVEKWMASRLNWFVDRPLGEDKIQDATNEKAKESAFLALERKDLTNTSKR